MLSVNGGNLLGYYFAVFCSFCHRSRIDICTYNDHAIEEHGIGIFNIGKFSMCSEQLQPSIG